MADQCYFDGEFYQCVSAATGETPAAAPTKWRRIRIPKEWRRAVGLLAYANLLSMDGQLEKALVVRGQGEAELEELRRESANAEGWRERPAVVTRN